MPKSPNMYFLDHNGRAKISLCSILTAFGYGSTMNIAFARRESEVLLETLGVLTATQVVLLWRWFSNK
jgi:hypothetical protein